jgi:predicted ATP-grasp superfamily ATP-dependent carboligase
LAWRENSLAEPDTYLVTALSGRALAVAVRRSGRRAVVVDLFGDSDTRAAADASLVVAGNLDDGFDAAALIAAAQELAPASAPARFGLVYSSGLESHPDLLAQLAAGRQLYGNSPETVARTKHPQAFFKLLDRLGIRYPAVSYSVPSDPTGWLTKRIGGSGGGHVTPAHAMSPVMDSYFQRRLSGRSVGVSFLADGRRSRVLGFGEQWPSPEPRSQSYRFGGLLQPAAVSERVAREVAASLGFLVRELGLVGLNSLDLIVDEDEFHVLEVNPRPGANLDIFDRGQDASLFELHIAACEGRLPERLQPPQLSTAMCVLYADAPAVVPRDLAWPEWVADRPAPGATIETGSPICTVLAAAQNRDAVRQSIAARTAFVRASLCLSADAGPRQSSHGLQPRQDRAHAS